MSPRRYYLRTNFVGLLLCFVGAGVSYYWLRELPSGAAIALFVGSAAGAAGMASEGPRWGGDTLRLWQGALTAFSLGLWACLAHGSPLLGVGVVLVLAEWALYRARPDATPHFVSDSLAAILACSGFVFLLFAGAYAHDAPGVDKLPRAAGSLATAAVLLRRARLLGCLVGLLVWCVLFIVGMGVVGQAGAGFWLLASLAGTLYAVDGLDPERSSGGNPRND